MHYVLQTNAKRHVLYVHAATIPNADNMKIAAPPDVITIAPALKKSCLTPLSAMMSS